MKNETTKQSTKIYLKGKKKNEAGETDETEVFLKYSITTL